MIIPAPLIITRHIHERRLHHEEGGDEHGDGERVDAERGPGSRGGGGGGGGGGGDGGGDGELEKVVVGVVALVQTRGEQIALVVLRVMRPVRARGAAGERAQGSRVGALGLAIVGD
jgi:hypothetical protein